MPMIDLIQKKICEAKIAAQRCDRAGMCVTAILWRNEAYRLELSIGEEKEEPHAAVREN
jgi:hypothetical protein